jgi:hypothetical protein
MFSCPLGSCIWTRVTQGLPSSAAARISSLKHYDNEWRHISKRTTYTRISSCQIFWKVVGLERGPLSLVSTIDELLGIKSSGSSPEIREYSRRDPSRRPRGTLYPQKLAITSPTSGGCSVGVVRSRTQATEFSFSLGLAIEEEYYGLHERVDVANISQKIVLPSSWLKWELLEIWWVTVLLKRWWLPNESHYFAP